MLTPFLKPLRDFQPPQLLLDPADHCLKQILLSFISLGKDEFWEWILGQAPSQPRCFGSVFPSAIDTCIPLTSSLLTQEPFPRGATQVPPY